MTSVLIQNSSHQAIINPIQSQNPALGRKLHKIFAHWETTDVVKLMRKCYDDEFSNEATKTAIGEFLKCYPSVSKEKKEKVKKEIESLEDFPTDSTIRLYINSFNSSLLRDKDFFSAIKMVNLEGFNASHMPFYQHHLDQLASHTTTLRELDLTYTNPDLLTLTKVLRANPELRVLNLQKNSLQDPPQEFLEALRDLKHLRIITLSHAGLTDLSQWTAYLPPSLRVLDIDNNPLQNHSAWLTQLNKLRSINLEKTNLTDNNAPALRQLIQSSNTLQGLDLSDNPLSKEFCSQLIALFPEPLIISYLMLSKTHLTEEEIQKIIQENKSYPTLSLLYIDGNNRLED